MTRLALSRASLLALALSVSAVAAPAIAQDAPHQHAAPPPPSPAPTASPAAPADHAGMDMSGMDMSGAGTPAGGMTMDMGRMQGGKAPPDARNSDDYADGYRNSTLPGYEMADKLSIPKVLVDELEFASGNEGQGVGWTVLVTQGQDDSKLWLRSQGLKNSKDRLDPESSVEALWWRSKSPFWGTLLGVRQDLGKGATTWLAAGVEGLAPYWFDVQLTGYVGDDGRLGARAKGAYEVRFTNRLILTPQVETNLYSKRSTDRELGGGFSNVELSARLRYEVSRKFAPYVGFVWERALDDTADFRRADRQRPAEHRVVVGLRSWW
ncbi:MULTISPECIES: copper resistance protein B [unclassified Caulobacter]|jgi:copper resistance protein B|uniref:copper resistance protein B n=2 Tax=unclassified Caulobacter TaxID=2648921 RepID=UPI000A4B7C05|nr:MULTISPECIES: copper resistance protein B [unclassified Caulobacter]MDR7232644.1 copper resistance protein B [Caulobacter sp. BE264]NQE65470.1 Copper resistance protein B [Caulobacter sp. RHG1]